MSAKKSVRELLAAGTWEKLSREVQIARVVEEIPRDIMFPAVKGRPMPPCHWGNEEQRRAFSEIKRWILDNYPGQISGTDTWPLADYVEYAEAGENEKANEIITYIIQRKPPKPRLADAPDPCPPPFYTNESVLEYFARTKGYQP